MDKKVGPIFGEFITTEKIKRRNYSDSEGELPSGRFYLLPAVLIIVIAILIGRAFFLQVAQGSYYRNLSDNNRIKTIIVHAPRGTITDREGKPLVYNVPGFRETVNGKTRLIDQEEAIKLLAQGKKDLEIDSLRQYPYKESMAHLLGYLGQVSEEELKTSEFSNYNSGDVIGKMGIEKKYESFLKGTPGKQLAEIDSQGKVVRKLGETAGVSGRNIKLTIDLDLQKKAYESLKARDRGVNIGFFGGNDSYWQVRYEKSSSGVPNRVMVGYKSRYQSDPYYSSTDPAKRRKTTGLFRYSVTSRPEQKMMGTMYGRNLGTHANNLPWTVLHEDHWIYEGTDLRNGDKIPNVYGYEYNTIYSGYPKANNGNYTVLSRTNSSPDAYSTIYKAPSGALVFSAGTTDWPWLLDTRKDFNFENAKAKRITKNILDRFVGITTETEAQTSFETFKSFEEIQLTTTPSPAPTP